MTYCGLAGTVNETDGTCVEDASLDGDDIAPVVVDIGLKVLIAVGTLATVIGLALLFRWFTKRKTL